MRLSEWGGWSAADWEHVEMLEARPDLERGEGAGHWTGELDGARKAWLRYRVRLTPLGSPEQRRFGLLPTASEDYAYGYSWNTLASVEIDGERSARAPALVMRRLAERRS